MDIVISFFRDTISGVWYVLYIIVCILTIFVILGVVGDRKRAIISDKLKEKRKRDIESGKASEIAARESKQILDVMSDEELDIANRNKNDNIQNINSNVQSTNSVQNVNNSSQQSTENLAKKEEVPQVLVLGDANNSNTN